MTKQLYVLIDGVWEEVGGPPAAGGGGGGDYLPLTGGTVDGDLTVNAPNSVLLTSPVNTVSSQYDYPEAVDPSDIASKVLSMETTDYNGLMLMATVNTVDGNTTKRAQLKLQGGSGFGTPTTVAHLEASEISLEAHGDEFHHLYLGPDGVLDIKGTAINLQGSSWDVPLPLKGVADPSDPNDAANKAYVDAAAGGGGGGGGDYLPLTGGQVDGPVVINGQFLVEVWDAEDPTFYAKATVDAQAGSARSALEGTGTYFEGVSSNVFTIEGVADSSGVRAGISTDGQTYLSGNDLVLISPSPVKVLADGEGGAPQRITNLADPVNPTDAVNLQTLEAAAGDYLPLTGTAVPEFALVSDTYAAIEAAETVDITAGELVMLASNDAKLTSNGTMTVKAATALTVRSTTSDLNLYSPNPIRVGFPNGDPQRLTNLVAPTGPSDGANKAYVDARTPKITVGTTAPGSPATNDVWIDTT